MRTHWAAAFVAAAVAALTFGVHAQEGSSGDLGPELAFAKAERSPLEAAPPAAVASDQLTLAQLVAVLRTAGWPEDVIPQAVDVAGCESSWSPTAVGDSGEQGLFQVHPVHAHRFDLFGLERDPMDPVHNASVALSIWRTHGWEAWTCQPGAESSG